MNVAQQDMVKALLNQGKTQEEIKKFLLVSNPTQQISDEEIAEISNPDQKKKRAGSFKRGRTRGYAIRAFGKEFGVYSRDL